MKARTRLIVAVLAGLGVAFLPMLLVGPTIAAGPTTVSWKSLPLLYGFGIVTALTPCVYPLIPITVSIFGGGKSARSRGHATALSATYVLGIAAMYSGLGLMSARAGHTFGNQFSNPWIVGFFTLAMLVLAASMFGAFELTLPSSLQSKLAGVGGFGFGSAFMMGLVCGIVAAPCTGPALFGVLAYVAAKGDMWLGFWSLFIYAIGLGTPFFILGSFSVKLPRSGAWMEAVKSVLGIMLVLTAISFARPFLPAAKAVNLGELVYPAVAALFVFLAVVAGTLDWSFHGDRREFSLKALGVVVLLAAISFRLGWIVQTVPERIEWLTDEAAAIELSKSTGKPMLVDFGAEWCSACMELEHKTYTDPTVRNHVMQKFVPLKVDCTDETDAVQALESKYGVVGLPLVTVVDKDGRQLESPRIAGFLKPPEFLQELAKAGVQ